VIPAFNDGGPLVNVLAELQTLGYSVVVVDDGSTPLLSLPNRASGVCLVRHCLNLGQGAAIETGVQFALQMGAQFLVTFDADGQHSASEIESLLLPLRLGRAEIALGSRFAEGGSALHISRSRLLALRVATLVSRLTTGLRLTDTHNGFRAMTASAAQKIRITQNRMAHASQILEEIARLSVPYVEVPVTITYTSYSVAKGQKLSNAFNILWESITARLT